MDFLDNLLPIIIVVVYVISLLLKKKSEGKKADDGKKKSGIGKAIEDIIGQVKEEIEKAKAAQDAQENKPKPVLQKQPAKIEPASKRSTPTPSRKTYLEQKSTMPASPKTKAKPAPVAPVTSDTHESQFGSASKKKTPKWPFDSDRMSAAELRKAIVLAEIIRPPLALRDD